MARRQLSPAQMADLSGLMDEIVHDPELRPHMAALIAKKFPQRASSFSDVALNNKIEGLRREMADREFQRHQRDAEDKAAAAREKLISSGYTKEQVDEIKSIMDKNGGMTDYEAGRILYQHYNKPTIQEMEPPIAERPGATWEFPTVNGKDGKPIPFADFVKNPSAAATNAAYTVITEFKRNHGMRI